MEDVVISIHFRGGIGQKIQVCFAIYLENSTMSYWP